jgi:holliday junction DNA helicase RuvA
MIGSLRGMLLDRTTRGEVVVECGGVGYRATVPVRVLADLGELGSPVFLHVHTHVREGALDLFGFASRDERECFEALLGAHGVGPALALAILAVHTPTTLRRAVADGDGEAFTLVPGVGKKTAARLLLELQSRLDVVGPDLDLTSAGHGGNGLDARADLRAALAELGYGPDEVREVLRDLPPEGAVEDLLRQALRLLGAVRRA